MSITSAGKQAYFIRFLRFIVERSADDTAASPQRESYIVDNDTHGFVQPDVSQVHKLIIGDF